MKKIFNQEVIDFVNKSMNEIKSEIDLDYCIENNIKFSNNEIDSSEIKLFSKESTDTAYKILHPDYKGN
ncbi:hypothetical protein [Polaribacter glomeratus]|uniref:Uncharacterized protein n=1 Tax=Polaribacter glomeratus TaxID=102 RepID=A0A2S7WGG6_9FLAO|nr:hypothetical protein [Polaribacter glomeratus]PQJ76516.1 hypothetical protein BTO16_11465 [Polaribacter glomeratus]TXD64186.1 hypothetical protein ESX12_15860 [Polaribacter glomeratus]